MLILLAFQSLACPGLGMMVCNFRARAVLPVTFNLPSKNAYSNINTHRLITNWSQFPGLLFVIVGFLYLTTFS